MRPQEISIFIGEDGQDFVNDKITIRLSCINSKLESIAVVKKTGRKSKEKTIKNILYILKKQLIQKMYC